MGACAERLTTTLCSYNFPYFSTLLEDVKEQLLMTIERTFHLTRDNAEKLHCELMQCVRRKDLITVFRMGEGPCQELDQAVLIALLKGKEINLYLSHFMFEIYATPHTSQSIAISLPLDRFS
ncbi:hypothetical protein AVEN_251365-1 [Araneus ventricosus]|uniref:Uncharacterized protein n=1 Tax=Araneus ventricosus TaxID=182803 RepID=A0A4Y2TNS7_ARAVE|nr:hypothetical protein AVEN_251365-1 [Araneus ventricosus]